MMALCNRCLVVAAFLLLLLSDETGTEKTPTETSDCPHKCSCLWKGGKQTVECVNASLTEIPAIADRYLLHQNLTVTVSAIH